MGRAPCCDKANVKKGPWSPEEDSKLKAYIEEHGTGGNWIALPQKIGLKRCGKSCRLRWLNYLRPNIKHGGFSEEEDNIICSLYISIGSRWSIIAAQLPGRTDNDIKNYWNTRLKKKLLGKSRRSENNRHLSPLSQDQKDVTQEPMSNAALERLQLHMQLQSLQNPFSSFYNDPALWPKTIQTLHSLNPRPTQPLLSEIAQLGQGHKSDFPDPPNVLTDAAKLRNTMAGELENCTFHDVLSPSERAANAYGNPVDSILLQKETEECSYGLCHQVPQHLQDELEALLNNKQVAGSVVLQDDHMYEYDCLSGSGSKDNLVFWSEFDAKSSAPSNSWESTSLIQSEEIFHDDELHCNL